MGRHQAGAAESRQRRLKAIGGGAAAADPDDLLRLHHGRRAAGRLHRCRCRDASRHGRCGVLRDARRHLLRPVPDAGLLCVAAGGGKACRERLRGWRQSIKYRRTSSVLRLSGRFLIARPIYATGSAKSEIKGIGEKQCLRNWKERLHSLRAARAALVLQSPSVWLRTERTWPSHTRKVPMRPRRSSRRLNALAERRSQFRRTPLMLAPSKPRSKRPWRHLAGSTSL